MMMHEQPTDAMIQLLDDVRFYKHDNNIDHLTVKISDPLAPN